MHVEHLRSCRATTTAVHLPATASDNSSADSPVSVLTCPNPPSDNTASSSSVQPLMTPQTNVQRLQQSLLLPTVTLPTSPTSVPHSQTSSSPPHPPHSHSPRHTSQSYHAPSVPTSPVSSHPNHLTPVNSPALRPARRARPPSRLIEEI